MASSTGGTLTRVTMVAPKTRVDLALPEDVPLADLLPTLLRFAGEDLAEEGANRGGWVLSRIGGRTLDSARTLSQLEVRDGELLQFTARDAVAPEPVFDDIVDAVATGTQGRRGRWTLATSRRVGLVVATIALVFGALAALTAGPPQLPGALAALVLAVALIIAGTIFSRALGSSSSGTLFGLLALPYALVGGVLVLAGDRSLGELGAPHVVVGGAMLVVFGVFAAIAVSAHSEYFLAAAISGWTLTIGALITLLTGAGYAGIAAVMVAIALGATPALPNLSFRLARLPMPAVPTGPEDLKSEHETVDGTRVLLQTEYADRYLTGLLTASAAICVGGTAVLVADGSWSAGSLVVVVALVLLLRARVFGGLLARLPLLIAGLTALGLLGVGAAAAGGLGIRLVGVLGAAVLLAVCCCWYGLSQSDRRASPVWGRLLDVFEVLLIVSVVPLALGVLGVYTWIRGLAG